MLVTGSCPSTFCFLPDLQFIVLRAVRVVAEILFLMAISFPTSAANTQDSNYIHPPEGSISQVNYSFWIVMHISSQNFLDSCSTLPREFYYVLSCLRSMWWLCAPLLGGWGQLCQEKDRKSLCKLDCFSSTICFQPTQHVGGTVWKAGVSVYRKRYSRSAMNIACLRRLDWKVCCFMFVKGQTHVTHTRPPPPDTNKTNHLSHFLVYAE